MIICDFCDQYRAGECRLGLKMPRRMSCRAFDPQLAGFCARPSDFVSAAQVVGMAVHFDVKGAELRKVRVMAAQEEAYRAVAARQLAKRP